MPGIPDNNVPLYMTILLWAFNACVGPNGWFVFATGIKEIFACIMAFWAAVAAQICTTTAALGVSFGKYLYALPAVDALQDILITPGCGPQVAGIVVCGLFVSYAVLAFGYSVWTFCLYPNTVSQLVLSVHGVHVFLPLVLASIVLGVITFDAEDQGDHKTGGNDEHDHTGDQPPSANSEHQPIQAAVHPTLTKGENNQKSPQSSIREEVQPTRTTGKNTKKTSQSVTFRKTGETSGACAPVSPSILMQGDVSALEVKTAEVLGTPSHSARDNRKRGHDNKILDREGKMRGQPFARVSASHDYAENNVMDTDTD